MSRQAEADRQRALLAALRDAGHGLPAGALALPVADRSAGLHAYRANAQAVAVRALTAAYPRVARLLGDEPMQALARDLWQAHPPVRGDLAWFGAELAEVVARLDELAEWPWLADVCRLDWAVHRAHSAADPPDLPSGLALLAEHEPVRLRLAFVPGSACVASAWPVHDIWRAQEGPADAPPEWGGAQAAWVWRRGHAVPVATLQAGERALHEATLAGQALGPAWDQAVRADPDFDFPAWLARALREGWLAGIHTSPT